jgi:hypothetical protein
MALKSLQHEHKKHLEREQALADILDTLRTGFNPNYQDMAVLEAVRGWEYHAGLPHINDVKKDDAGDDEVENIVESEEEKKEGGEELMTAEELEKEIGPLLETDYVLLLLEHEKHVNSPSSESICKISLFMLKYLSIFRSVRFIFVHPRITSSSIRNLKGYTCVMVTGSRCHPWLNRLFRGFVYSSVSKIILTPGIQILPEHAKLSKMRKTVSSSAKMKTRTL